MFIKRRVIECVSKAQSDFFHWKPSGDWGEILFSGGFGSGKTFSLALWVCKYLSYPNTDIAMGRLAAVDMQRSTWTSLTESWTTPDGVTHPPLLPQGAIKKFDTINKVVYFWNGSTISFLGLEDVEKNRSRQFHVGIAEEISELTEQQFTTFSSRIRKIHPLGNIVACASNAVPKHHWIYRHFVLSGVKGSVECFISPTTDNLKNLPKGYLEKLKRLPEKERQRYLEGMFVSDGDLVFYCFNPIEHVVKDCPFEPTGYIVSQDFGGGARMSSVHLLTYTVDSTEQLHIHVAKEFVKHRAQHCDVIDWQNKYKQLTNSICVYDGANAAIRNDMESSGWTCHQGIKNLVDSYITTNSLFTEGRLTISPECETLINQLNGAEYDSQGKTEKKTGWDAIDSGRYGWCFLERTAFAKGSWEVARFSGSSKEGHNSRSGQTASGDRYGFGAGTDSIESLEYK